jgi:hypothetical protein
MLECNIDNVFVYLRFGQKLRRHFLDLDDEVTVVRLKFKCPRHYLQQSKKNNI